jgi:hypothetical protein
MSDRSANFPGDYPAPTWLPDWRDEKKYEDHASDRDEWAWEYLRRNPEYQADYAKWEELPDTDIAEDGRVVWSPKKSLSAGDWVPMAFCHGPEPALSRAENAGDYYARTGVRPDTLYVHVCRKWGISDPVDPASDSSPDWDTQGEVSREMPPYSIPEFDDTFTISGFKSGYEDRKGRLLFAWWPSEYDQYLSRWAFDLRFNIDDQIDLLRDILKEMQDEAKAVDPVFGNEPIHIVGRPSAKGFSTALMDLRILDAKWSGASDGEIIKVLLGEPNKPPYADGGNYEADQRAAKKQNIKDAMGRITNRIVGGGWGDLVRWSFLPQSPKNKTRKPSKAE